MYINCEHELCTYPDRDRAAFVGQNSRAVQETRNACMRALGDGGVAEVVGAHRSEAGGVRCFSVRDVVSPPPKHPLPGGRQTLVKEEDIGGGIQLRPNSGAARPGLDPHPHRLGSREVRHTKSPIYNMAIHIYM